MSPRDTRSLIEAFNSWRRSIGNCTVILWRGIFITSNPAKPVPVRSARNQRRA